MAFRYLRSDVDLRSCANVMNEKRPKPLPTDVELPSFMNYEGPKLSKLDLQLLRQAKANWQQDSLGVRGNPVLFHHQQSDVNQPRSTVERRQAGDTYEYTTPSTREDISKTNSNPSPPLPPVPPAPPDPPEPPPDDGDPSTTDLNFYHGEDVGFPGSWGGFDGDAATVISITSGTLGRVFALGHATETPFTQFGARFIVHRVDVPNGAHGGATIQTLLRNNDWISFGGSADLICFVP